VQRTEPFPVKAGFEAGRSITHTVVPAILQAKKDWLILNLAEKYQLKTARVLSLPAARRFKACLTPGVSPLRSD